MIFFSLKKSIMHVATLCDVFRLPMNVVDEDVFQLGCCGDAFVVTSNGRINGTMGIAVSHWYQPNDIHVDWISAPLVSTMWWSSERNTTGDSVVGFNGRRIGMNDSAFRLGSSVEGDNWRIVWPLIMFLSGQLQGSGLNNILFKELGKHPEIRLDRLGYEVYALDCDNKHVTFEGWMAGILRILFPNL